MKSVFPILALIFGFSVFVPQADAQKRDDERARDLFIEGEAHYAAGRYEEAAKVYEEAFELSQRPELLFNIANAYERMGEYTTAADYLRRYVQSPRARDVVSVRERIRRLEVAAEEQRRRQEEERKQAELEAQQASSNTGAGPTKPQRNPAVFWLAGSGAAAAGAVVFGLLANAAGNDAAKSCGDAPDGGLVCRETADGALTRETIFAISADVSAVAAVATAGVGLYLYLTYGNEDESPAEQDAATTQIAPTLMPNGFGVTMTGRF
ncbi:tetratricopeptide repeat protein [Haliangium sp.]|uniref:tetratricopeptide repeat protein n=1 Tax=Haliangium sp. TaxID=2663208 RepID=UPI003D1094F1